MCDCFRDTHNHKRPAPKREYVELEYVPAPDKILTTRQYRAKLERNRKGKSQPYPIKAKPPRLVEWLADI